MPSDRPLAGALGRLLPVALALGLIALLVWLPLSRTWRSPVSPLDEGMSLTYADLLLDGKVAAADFDTTFPPGTHVAVAAGFLISGPRVAAERAIGFGFDLILLASVALLLRRHGRNAALVGTVAVALLQTRGGTSVFPWGTGSTALLATAAAITTAATCRTDRWVGVWELLSGLAAGFTVATRLDLAVGVGVLAIFVWFDLPLLRRWFAGGLVVGLGPLFLQVLVAGPILTVRKLVVEPAFVWGPYRRTPVSEVDPEVWWRFGLLVAVVAVVLAWGIHASRTRRGPERVACIAVAMLVLPTVPYASQRLDAGHSAAALVLALIALLAVVTDVLRKWELTPGRSTAGAVVLCAALLVPTTIDNEVVRSLEFPGGIDAADAVVIGESGRALFVAAAVGEPLQKISDELVARAVPGERLVVGVSDPRQVFLVDTNLYFLFPSLEPGTYYLEFNPGVVNGSRSGYADDLRTTDWIILNSAYDGVAEADRQPVGPDEPIEVVDDEFCEVASAGTFRLLERCG